MKRIISITLFLLLMLSLTACKSNKAELNINENASAENGEQSDTVKEPTEAKEPQTQQKEETEETEEEADPNKELNEYMASLPQEEFPRFILDKRFSIYYGPKYELLSDTAKDADVDSISDRTAVFRFPEDEVYITVSKETPEAPNYERCKKDLEEKYEGIVIYEYGDESLTALLDNGKDGINADVYLAIDNGSIYTVIKTSPSSKAEIYGKNEFSYSVWWE